MKDRQEMRAESAGAALILAASYSGVMSGTGSSICLSSSLPLLSPQHHILLRMVHKLATLSPWIFSSGSLTEKGPPWAHALERLAPVDDTVGGGNRTLKVQPCWRKDISEWGLWEFIVLPQFWLFLSASCGQLRCDLSDSCSATHCHAAPAIIDFSSETINPDKLPSSELLLSCYSIAATEM